MKPVSSFRNGRKSNRAKLTLRIVAIAATVQLAACANVYDRATKIGDADTPGIKPGDRVECEMRNGVTREFVVIEKKAGWLIGKETSVYAPDAVRITKTDNVISNGNEALILLTIGLVGYGLALGELSAKIRF